MNKDQIIEVLTTVARGAASETSATHPEDIAVQMCASIEGAAMTLDVLEKKGFLKKEQA